MSADPKTQDSSCNFNEPWHQGPHYKSDVESTQGYIAECKPFDTALGAERARRIVACVNACAGMADPGVELARLGQAVNRLVYTAALVIDDWERGADGTLLAAHLKALKGAVAEAASNGTR